MLDQFGHLNGHDVLIEGGTIPRITSPTRRSITNIAAPAMFTSSQIDMREAPSGRSSKVSIAPYILFPYHELQS